MRETFVQVPVAQLLHAVSQALLHQTPSLQNVDMHSVPAPQISPFFFGPPGAGPHEPTPLHVIPAHSPAGSVPCGYGRHAPSLFGWLQDRHGPVQAFVQQTPSTQKLEWH